jgi:hypothetical protein
MKLREQIEQVKRNLEKEFENNAIKVSTSFDIQTRFLSVGVDHPLYPNFVVNGIILPKDEYQKELDWLFNVMKQDVETINKSIGESYERDC